MAKRTSKRRQRRRSRPQKVTSHLARIGYEKRFWRDLYYAALTMKWPSFFALLAVAYGLFNAFFALLDLVEPHGIGNVTEPGFGAAFFFSVQTMATIGFGVLYPASLYANILVSIEVLLGLCGFAVATGIIFARFSRPTARVLFSRVAVINQLDGVDSLIFRCANERANLIVDAQIRVYLARQEFTREGRELRRTIELPLVRDRNPLFTLSWTVIHQINRESPLHGADKGKLAAQTGVLIVTLTGLDEGLGQTVFARHIYESDEILWGKHLADILIPVAQGQWMVDYQHFHDIEEEAAD